MRVAMQQFREMPNYKMRLSSSKMHPTLSLYPFQTKTRISCVATTPSARLTHSLLAWRLQKQRFKALRNFKSCKKRSEVRDEAYHQLLLSRWSQSNVSESLECGAHLKHYKQGFNVYLPHRYSPRPRLGLCAINTYSIDGTPPCTACPTGEVSGSGATSCTRLGKYTICLQER